MSPGFTPQYTALESVYEKYKDKGLVIVGVPPNNFGNQESGSKAEIREFNSGRFHVKFPMTAVLCGCIRDLALTKLSIYPNVTFQIRRSI